MTDILKILRNYIPGENNDVVPQRIAEAADEIERLRAQVRAAREFVKRNPALTSIDLAEFEVFLKAPAMIAMWRRSNS